MTTKPITQKSPHPPPTPPTECINHRCTIACIGWPPVFGWRTLCTSDITITHGLTLRASVTSCRGPAMTSLRPHSKHRFPAPSGCRKPVIGVCPETTHWLDDPTDNITRYWNTENNFFQTRPLSLYLMYCRKDDNSLNRQPDDCGRWTEGHQKKNIHPTIYPT